MIRIIIFLIALAVPLVAEDTAPLNMELSGPKIVEVRALQDLKLELDRRRAVADKQLDLIMLDVRIARWAVVQAAQTINDWILSNSPDADRCRGLDVDAGKWTCVPGPAKKTEAK